LLQQLKRLSFVFNLIYGVQGVKESRVQGFKGSRVQGFKDSRIQGFKDSRIQGLRKISLRFLNNGRDYMR
jgi:hypothetical protein